MSIIRKNQLIVQKGLKLLIDDHAYSQIIIHRKLKVLDVRVSRSSISNLKNGQRSVGSQLWKSVAQGVLVLVERELCLRWNPTEENYVKYPTVWLVR